MWKIVRQECQNQTQAHPLTKLEKVHYIKI
jgi:hypothetical protein